MLVHRTRTETVDPVAELKRLRLRAVSCHEDVTDLLIRLGQLESAVADEFSPECDAEVPVSGALRCASLAAGHAFRASMSGRRADLYAWIARLRAALEFCSRHELPPSVSLRVPEGYAFYALYPEMYVEATLEFCKAVQPKRVVAIGIRSIGTSLSAVVGATLEDCACQVESWTLRPRGHPFERKIVLDAGLRGRMAKLSDALFVLVDEGPGLSGSSITSVADDLSESGVPDDRIAFFPGWVPDGAAFRSPAARVRWPRHAKYHVPFEAVHPVAALTDLSAGRWRERLPADAPWPAVHPWHERRKYLGAGFVSRFAGLGRFGRAKLPRAEMLSEENLSTRPISLVHGFLQLEWVEGRPLTGPADVTRDFLDTLARYLALLARQPSQPGGASFDELVEMICINTGSAESFDAYRGMVNDARPVAIDARMLPHEWLETPAGYIKTDALDHHDDHFYPGPQDIAWDLASAQVEFDLDRSAAEYVAARCGAPGLLRRLPFYTKAYNAFRLGYAALAAETLAGTPDGARFDSLRTALAS